MHAELPLWTFAEIAARETARAALLESAPSSEVIQASVIARFANALNVGQLRIGMEESESDQHDLRTVLQFHVGETLYDRFFNATTDTGLSSGDLGRLGSRTTATSSPCYETGLHPRSPLKSWRVSYRRNSKTWASLQSRGTRSASHSSLICRRFGSVAG